MPFSLLAFLMILIGLANGLRTLTPFAVLCWGAIIGWYSFAHTSFSFLDHWAALVVLTILAVAELIGDKLPKTPPRIQPFPLISRVVFGAGAAVGLAFLAGAIPWIAAVIGGVSAVVGAYAGYAVRRALTRSGRMPDLPVALVEDCIAIGISFFVVSRF